MMTVPSHAAPTRNDRRILCIDGGGMKGVFPASFLATVEAAVGAPIASYFDLIAGTSTGGIIAILLGLGYTAGETLEIFERLGPRVFGGRPLLRIIRRLGLSKYDDGPLREVLEEACGARRFGEASTRLIVPATNLENGDVYVYKTAHHERFEFDFDVPAIEVALAATAAPTYFPTHHSTVGVPLVDGGLWAISPVAVAAVEAVGVLGWPRDAIRILSLGCTSEPVHAALTGRTGLGVLPWGLSGLGVLFAAQSAGALQLATILVGREHIVRVNPIVGHRRFRMDSVREIAQMRGLGHAEARHRLAQLREVFFHSPAERFQPLRLPGGPIIDRRASVLSAGGLQEPGL